MKEWAASFGDQPLSSSLRMILRLLRFDYSWRSRLYTLIKNFESVVKIK
jgi:hypothetical protein